MHLEGSHSAAKHLHCKLADLLACDHHKIGRATTEGCCVCIDKPTRSHDSIPRMLLTVFMSSYLV